MNGCYQVGLPLVMQPDTVVSHPRQVDPVGIANIYGHSIPGHGCEPRAARQDWSLTSWTPGRPTTTPKRRRCRRCSHRFPPPFSLKGRLWMTWPPRRRPRRRYSAEQATCYICNEEKNVSRMAFRWRSENVLHNEREETKRLCCYMFNKWRLLVKIS